MLARRRELIFIIAGLLGVNILLGWLLGRLWKDYRSRAQWLYAGARPEPIVVPSAGLNQTGRPQSFVEIVDRDVFSPLRGSQPAQPQEEAKTPKLPLLFGTMNLGNGWFALMAAGDSPPLAAQRVLPGEEIGGYKLVSIGTSNVVIEWQEKKITLDISESARRGADMMGKTSSGRYSAGANAGNPAPVTTRLLGSPATAGAPPPPPALTPAAPADVPVGTVVGGKQKVLVPSPFGMIPRWVDVNAPGSQPPQSSGGPKK